MTEAAAKLREFFVQNDFLPIGREAYPVFQNYSANNMLIDLSAILVNTWGVAANSVYKNIDGYLCVVWFCDGSPFHEGLPFYFTVLRPAQESHNLKHIIDILYDLSIKAGVNSLPIESIEERFLEEYKSIAGYDIKTSYSDDHSEYAYKTIDVLEMSGGVNMKKRNRLRKFLDEPNVRLEPLTKKNVAVCMDIHKEWCDQRDCSFCESFAGCEKEALQVMVDIFDDKINNGFIGYVDDAAVGYSIADKTNDKVSYLYFGKSIVQDFFVYMIYMVVQTYVSDVEYLNLSEDMGNMGLRNFKKHIGAHELWKKHLCVFTKAGA